MTDTTTLPDVYSVGQRRNPGGTFPPAAGGGGGGSLGDPPGRTIHQAGEDPDPPQPSDPCSHPDTALEWNADAAAAEAMKKFREKAAELGTTISMSENSTRSCIAMKMVVFRWAACLQAIKSDRLKNRRSIETGQASHRTTSSALSIVILEAASHLQEAIGALLTASAVGSSNIPARRPRTAIVTILLPATSPTPHLT